MTGELNASSGVTLLCLPMAGRYVLKFDACYTFEKPLYEISTPQDSELVVRATDFLVTALVSSATKLSEEIDFTLNVKGSSKIDTVEVGLSLI